MRTSLPKGQIAAKHRPALISEFLGERHQKRRIAISAGSVGQNESIPGWRGGAMQEAAHGWSR
jgi:hypothetical protein